MGGIKARDLESIVFQLDGTIAFSNNIEEWPRDSQGNCKYGKPNYFYNSTFIFRTCAGMLAFLQPEECNIHFQWSWSSGWSRREMVGTAWDRIFGQRGE